MANFQIKDFTSGLAVKIRAFLVNTDENVAVHSLVDTANGEILGTKTDAKSTATDTTSVSSMSVWKQISASVQAIATSVAGTLTVATHAVTGSGNFASTVADGANTTLGAKADAKSTATDTTSVSLMQVFKQISASVQALVTAIGSTAWDLGAGTGGSRTQRVVIDSSQLDGSKYETVAASQTNQVMGSTGATGDYLREILVTPATTSPGNIQIKDGSNTAITVFTGGASSVSNLVPFTISLGLTSTSGAWQVTTGASVSAIGIGNFT